eukprot:10176879-Alexandrium_andersonii.AAC.1
MSASLVGSEMCIRDSTQSACHEACHTRTWVTWVQKSALGSAVWRRAALCLLYTSDAADDM